MIPPLMLMVYMEGPEDGSSFDKSKIKNLLLAYEQVKWDMPDANIVDMIIWYKNGGYPRSYDYDYLLKSGLPPYNDWCNGRKVVIVAMTQIINNDRHYGTSPVKIYGEDS